MYHVEDGMISFDGRDINEMHGYIDEMEVNYMRESLTPLATGRRVSLTVDCYDSTISNIAYEVRSIDGTRLIEDTKIEEYVQQDGKIELSFTLASVFKGS